MIGGVSAVVIESAVNGGITTTEVNPHVPYTVDVNTFDDVRGPSRRRDRATGHRWSTHLGPTVGTALCMHAHVGFLVQGRMQVEYPDGCVVAYTAPQAVLVDPGHDACVIGDETAVLVQVDFERDTVARFNLS